MTTDDTDVTECDESEGDVFTCERCDDEYSLDYESADHPGHCDDCADEIESEAHDAMVEQLREAVEAVIDTEDGELIEHVRELVANALAEREARIEAARKLSGRR